MGQAASRAPPSRAAINRLRSSRHWRDRLRPVREERDASPFAEADDTEVIPPENTKPKQASGNRTHLLTDFPYRQLRQSARPVPDRIRALFRLLHQRRFLLVRRGNLGGPACRKQQIHGPRRLFSLRGGLAPHRRPLQKRADVRLGTRRVSVLLTKIQIESHPLAICRPLLPWNANSLHPAVERDCGLSGNCDHESLLLPITPIPVDRRRFAARFGTLKQKFFRFSLPTPPGVGSVRNSPSSHQSSPITPSGMIDKPA